ncbi:MAG: porin family protein [Chitinophagaceae bacterium]
MKKIILSGIVLLLVTTLFAQHSNVHFGIKAGANFASMKNGEINTDSKAGLNVGGLAHIHLSKTFAIQPEVVFSMQGGTHENGDKNKFNYLNVPVLAQYMFGEGFRVQTGPQLGLLLSAKNEINGVEVDIDDLLKKSDFGWAFGASYITKQGIGIDGRYNLGITSISKNDFELKNRVWQVGLFYQFKH